MPGLLLQAVSFPSLSHCSGTEICYGRLIKEAAMTQQKTPKPVKPKGKSAQRKEKLAAELKSNILKRKQQAKARHGQTRSS